jgi:hypothetical protein
MQQMRATATGKEPPQEGTSQSALEGYASLANPSSGE